MTGREQSRLTLLIMVWLRLREDYVHKGSTTDIIKGMVAVDIQLRALADEALHTADQESRTFDLPSFETLVDRKID